MFMCHQKAAVCILQLVPSQKKGVEKHKQFRNMATAAAWTERREDAELRKSLFTGTTSSRKDFWSSSAELKTNSERFCEVKTHEGVEKALDDRL